MANASNKSLKRSSSTCIKTPAKVAKNERGERKCECDTENCDCYLEEEPYSECWPKDWLPKDCPGVRVIAITYTTDPYLWRPVWVKEKLRYIYLNTSLSSHLHFTSLAPVLILLLFLLLRAQQNFDARAHSLLYYYYYYYYLSRNINRDYAWIFVWYLFLSNTLLRNG